MIEMTKMGMARTKINKLGDGVMRSLSAVVISTGVCDRALSFCINFVVRRVNHAQMKLITAVTRSILGGLGSF